MFHILLYLGTMKKILPTPNYNALKCGNIWIKNWVLK